MAITRAGGRGRLRRDGTTGAANEEAVAGRSNVEPPPGRRRGRRQGEAGARARDGEPPAPSSQMSFPPIFLQRGVGAGGTCRASEKMPPSGAPCGGRSRSGRSTASAPSPERTSRIGPPAASDRSSADSGSGRAAHRRERVPGADHTKDAGRRDEHGRGERRAEESDRSGRRRIRGREPALSEVAREAQPGGGRENEHGLARSRPGTRRATPRAEQVARDAADLQSPRFPDSALFASVGPEEEEPARGRWGPRRGPRRGPPVSPTEPRSSVAPPSSEVKTPSPPSRRRAVPWPGPLRAR